MINYKVILPTTQLQAIWEKPSDSLEVKGGERVAGVLVPPAVMSERNGAFSLCLKPGDKGFMRTAKSLTYAPWSLRDIKAAIWLPPGEVLRWACGRPAALEAA